MSRKPKQTFKTLEQKAVPDFPQVPIYAVEARLSLLMLRLTGFLLICLAILAWFQPDLRLWGIHHLAFLPPEVSIMLICAAAFLWTPFGGKAFGWIFRKTKVLTKRSALLWAFVAGVSFFALRVSVPLLGDGVLWIKELAWIGEFQARGNKVDMTRWKIRKEPLEITAHEVVFRTAYKFRPPDYIGNSFADQQTAIQKRMQWFNTAARNTYVWYSIVVGIFTVYLLITFARRWIPDISRSAFLLVLFTSAGMLLFCGYIEHYSLASMILIAFLLSGIQDIFRPDRFPWRTTVMFLVCVSAHLSMLFLLPCIIYLLYSFYSRKKDQAGQQFPLLDKWIYYLLGAFFVLGVAGYVVVKGWKGWLSMLPLFARFSKDKYTLFAAVHGLDLINLLILIAVPALILLITLRLPKRVERSTQIQNSFLILAALGGTAFAFTFNTNLGMARDWDVLMLALWSLLIFAAWRIAQTDFGLLRNDILAAIVGFAVLIVFPFILVQANEDESVARMEAVLRMDSARSAYGWENMAVYYESKDNLEGRIRAWKNAATIAYKNPRYKVNVCVALRLAGRLEEAEMFALSAALKSSKNAYQLNYLAMDHANRGALEKARQLLYLSQTIEPADTSTTSLINQVNADIERRRTAAK